MIWAQDSCWLGLGLFEGSGRRVAVRLDRPVRGVLYLGSLAGGDGAVRIGSVESVPRSSLPRETAGSRSIQSSPQALLLPGRRVAAGPLRVCTAGLPQRDEPEPGTFEPELRTKNQER